MPHEHESLVQQAASNEAPAIDALLERHLPALRAYVRLQAGAAVRARESCSDLAQSVCREVLGDLDRFEYRGETAFKHWLFSRALNKIKNRARFYRAEKRDIRREDDDQSYSLCYADLVTPSRIMTGREQVEEVEEVFEQLSEEHRQVVVLAKVVGLTHGEIAAEMGRTEEASRMLLNRALVRLTGLLHQRRAGGGD